MKKFRLIGAPRLLLVTIVVVCSISHAAQTIDNGLFHKDYTIDGVGRQALIYAPASADTKPSPLVFAFHGHGGNSRNAARSFRIHREWPSAIVVYMQGLPTPGRLVDPEGKRPGWQVQAGDQGDRDLKFFDAVLADLKSTYKVNLKQVFCTGHSNGGAFTYLLWAERGDVFTAVAPSAAPGVRIAGKIRPKPAMHLAGERDELVKFEWQERTISEIRRVNQCNEEGVSWDTNCTLYGSKVGAPVVTYIHPGGHQFTVDAPRLIVKFFKQAIEGFPARPATAEKQSRD